MWKGKEVKGINNENDEKSKGRKVLRGEGHGEQLEQKEVIEDARERRERGAVLRMMEWKERSILLKPRTLLIPLREMRDQVK